MSLGSGLAAHSVSVKLLRTGRRFLAGISGHMAYVTSLVYPYPVASRGRKVSLD